MTTKNDIFPGKIFGRWTVLKKSEPKHSQCKWLCLCVCGSEKTVYASFLRNGISTSCGCFRKEQVIKAKTIHGHAKNTIRNPTYRSWESMKNRVFSDSYKGKKYYKDLGVVMCNEWLDFTNFLKYMGERPIGTTLDRINPFGNYEPNNCRWADAKTQANNKRNQIAKL